MIRKGNKCHAINNIVFLNKRQAEKSRKSQNERFTCTLSTANFRMVGFSPSIGTNAASSCLPRQIFSFSSNLFTRFKKSNQKNSLPLPKPTRNTREIANKFMTVASGEINLQCERSHLSPVFQPDCAIAGIPRCNERGPPERRKKGQFSSLLLQGWTVNTGIVF